MRERLDCEVVNADGLLRVSSAVDVADEFFFSLIIIIELAAHRRSIVILHLFL